MTSIAGSFVCAGADTVWSLSWLPDVKLLAHRERFVHITL